MYLCLLLIKVCIREFFFQWGREGYTFQMLRTNAIPISRNRHHNCTYTCTEEEKSYNEHEKFVDLRKMDPIGSRYFFGDIAEI